MGRQTRVVAQNDNWQVPALEFLDLPERFIEAYHAELLAWAARREERTTIQCWQFPDTHPISLNYQHHINLRCDAAVDPKTGHLRLTIRPATERDAENVRTHCEALPAIWAAKRAWAQAQRDKPRGYVSAVFEKIPDYFVERYGVELREWGRNLKKIGLVKHIVLREGQFSDASPNEELGPVLRRVELRAEIERLANDQLRLVIRPSTEEDEAKIRKHCEKMQRLGVKSVASLVEPERAGIPVLPDRYS